MIAPVLRHLVIAPLFLAVVVVTVVLSPALLLGSAILSLVVDRRQWRPVRGLLFIVIYGVHDATALLIGFGLWLRLGGRGAMHGERMQARHYRLIAWLLSRLSRQAERVLGLRVDIEGRDVEEELAALHRPLIVLSRHAGPGDSFLLVHQLLARGRRPRIVLRSTLQLDPSIDLLGNRLPFCFVSRAAGNSAEICRRISTAAGEMDQCGALLLFPEGGNVTRQRRRGAIRRLLRSGLRRRARQAAEMQHLMAPRPAGVLAALAAAPSAAVVFVAHSGLAGMDAQLWRRVPVDRSLRVRLWLAPPEHIPATDEGRIEWLFDWWLRLDAWVAHDDAENTSSESILAQPAVG